MLGQAAVCVTFGHMAVQGLEQIGDQASSAIVDITAPEAAGQLKDAFQGVEALVIATSAKPQMKPQPEDAPSGPPTFFYPEGQMPEQVRHQACGGLTVLYPLLLAGRPKLHCCTACHVTSRVKD